MNNNQFDCKVELLNRNKNSEANQQSTVCLNLTSAVLRNNIDKNNFDSKMF